MKLVGCTVLTGILLFESAVAYERSSVTQLTQTVPQSTSVTPAQAPPTSESAAESAASRVTDLSGDRTKDFVRAVLGDTEDVWDALFHAMANRPYPRPKVVLVSRSAISGCGTMDVSAGPLYCAADSNVYLDPAFLRKVVERSGDFAAAYAIVHEIGRHVQSALRTVRQPDAATDPTSQSQDGQLQAGLEMQADCYVGVWTYFVQRRGLTESREIEIGSAAALALGGAANDSQYVIQRLQWFKQGLASGDPRSCDLQPAPGSARPR